MLTQEDVEMRNEERRALVLLGLAAIFASILAAALSAEWSSNGKLNDTSFFFNIPPSFQVRHATFYWIPILEYLVGGWVVYAFFAFWYFSTDWLSSNLRLAVRFGSTAFMGVYVLYIVGYIPLVYLDVVYVTDPNIQATFTFSY